MNLSFYFTRLKDSIFYLGAALVKLPIAIFSSPMFAKNLSGNDFAAMGYFNALSTFLMPIMALMFYNYYMSGYHERSEEKSDEILQSLISFLIIIDVFIVTFSFIILKYYLISSGSTFDAYPLGIIVFVTAMFNIGIGFWGIKLRFERKSFKYFLLQTSTTLFGTGFGLLLVVKYQMGASGRLLPNMICNIALFLLFFGLTIKQFKINFIIIRSAILFCYPMILSVILALPISYADKLFLERIHNNDEFALYNIAGGISGYLGMATSALFQSFQPDIFKYTEKKSKHILIQILLVLLLLFILGSVLFIIIAPYAVEYLTAGRYIGAIKYIYLFVIITCLEPITYFFTYVIIALKLPKLDLMNQIVIAVISIISYSYVISIHQYFGALYVKIGMLSFLLLMIIVEVHYRKSKFIGKFKTICI